MFSRCSSHSPVHPNAADMTSRASSQPGPDWPAKDSMTMSTSACVTRLPSAAARPQNGVSVSVASSTTASVPQPALEHVLSGKFLHGAQSCLGIGRRPRTAVEQLDILSYMLDWLGKNGAGPHGGGSAPAGHSSPTATGVPAQVTTDSKALPLHGAARHARRAWSQKHASAARRSACQKWRLTQSSQQFDLFWTCTWSNCRHCVGPVGRNIPVPRQ